MPIAPHALSNRPIVPRRFENRDQIVGGRDVNVNFDMQSFTALELNDTIEVRRSKHTVPFLHPIGYSYYATLRKKLHWNEHASNETTRRPDAALPTPCSATSRSATSSSSPRSISNSTAAFPSFR